MWGRGSAKRIAAKLDLLRPRPKKSLKASCPNPIRPPSPFSFLQKRNDVEDVEDQLHKRMTRKASWLRLFSKVICCPRQLRVKREYTALRLSSSANVARKLNCRVSRIDRRVSRFDRSIRDTSLRKCILRKIVIKPNIA